jgi:hypothetical protein
MLSGEYGARGMPAAKRYGEDTLVSKLRTTVLISKRQHRRPGYVRGRYDCTCATRPILGRTLLEMSRMEKENGGTIPERTSLAGCIPGIKAPCASLPSMPLAPDLQSLRERASFDWLPDSLRDAADTLCDDDAQRATRRCLSGRQLGRVDSLG